MNENIGAGSLQPKNGVWYAVFYNNDTKKYVWRTTRIKIPNVSTRTKTYKDALREAQEKVYAIRDELVNKKPPVIQVEENIEPILTVSELVQDWLSTNAKREIRQSTLASYEMYAKNRIYPFFDERYPDVDVKDITYEIMDKFAKTLRDDGLKTSSIRKYITPIRDAFAFGVDEELVKVNPILRYKYVPQRQTLEEKESEKKVKRRSYSRDEVKAMMRAVEKEIDAPATIPVVLALRLGLRREEILGLRYSDIDFDKKVVKVQNTVTNIVNIVEEENTKSVAGGRKVPLDNWTLKYLKYLRNLQEEKSKMLDIRHPGYVYLRDDLARYYPDTCDKQLKKFLKRNNLNKITLHELRHTFCTMLIAAGKDPKTVQAIMGHEDSRMTIGLYSHVVEEKIFSAADAVEFFLAS